MSAESSLLGQGIRGTSDVSRVTTNASRSGNSRSVCLHPSSRQVRDLRRRKSWSTRQNKSETKDDEKGEILRGELQLRIKCPKI